MRYALRCLENQRLFTDPDRPWLVDESAVPWIVASEMREVARFEVEATSVLDAAGEAFNLGNDPSEPADLNGARWPHRSVRSMSSGDVVEVGTPDGPVLVAVLSWGWAMLPPSEIPKEVHRV